MRLLLVEDHPGLRDTLAAHLRGLGYATDAFATGLDAIEAASLASYDAGILDLGLPDIDGIDVLRRLRRDAAATFPVIVLTARDAVQDRVTGLDSGADDYILKPFDLDEFDARLRTILRRPGRRREKVERFADIGFDTISRTVSVGDRALDLTRRETALLEELLRAQGRTVVRDELAERIYGHDDRVSANAIEAVASRVRRRLAAAAAATTVEAVRGIGYRLRASS